MCKICDHMVIVSKDGLFTTDQLGMLSGLMQRASVSPAFNYLFTKHQHNSAYIKRKVEKIPSNQYKIFLSYFTLVCVTAFSSLDLSFNAVKATRCSCLGITVKNLWVLREARKNGMSLEGNCEMVHDKSITASRVQGLGTHTLG